VRETSAAKKQVKLTWVQSVSSGITHNTIYRSIINGGPYTPLATVAATTTFMDRTAKSGTNYYYVVTARNAAQESPYSNQATARTR